MIQSDASADFDTNRNETRRRSPSSPVRICALLLTTGIIAWFALRYVPPTTNLAGLEETRTTLDQLIVSGIRIAVIILALAGWHATQHLIGAKKSGDPGKAAGASSFLTDSDFALGRTAPINRYLNDHPVVADWLLIISSIVIDQLGVFLLLDSIIGPSLRPFVGLLILFALRQICQALTALPPPVGMIWRDPGFPSIFVTYGVSNDLFFSGHTALAVYGAWELASLGNGWLAILAAAIVLFQIVTVLVLRAHYTMDVFAGIVAALFVAKIAARVAPVFDHALLLL